jgi:enoyl-CoA hydratase/carnithine racemase
MISMINIIKNNKFAFKNMYFISEPVVLTEVIGKVFLVGINRPEKRNCVNQATSQLLFEAFNHFEKNDAVRVAVLYGKGFLK